MGGAEISVKKLAEELVKQGHNISVLCTGDESVNENINGVNVYRIKTNNLSRIIKSKNYFLGRINKLMEFYNIFNYNLISRTLKMIGPDVVHVNTISGFSIVLLNVIKRNKIPIIFTARDYSLVCPRATLLKRSGLQCDKCNLICSFYRLINKSNINKINILTSPSKFTLSKLTTIYDPNKPQKVVYNAIDFNLSEIYDAISIKKNIIKDKIVFLYLGTLSESKGIVWLIETFKEISNKDIELRIAGKGKLEDYIISQTIADGRIKFLGYLEEEQINQELLYSDALIVSSIWNEPFGRVVIDAYRMATPVIATKVGGIPEIVQDCKTGYLVKPLDTSDLIEKMSKFIYNEVDIEDFQQNICEMIQMFSIDKQVEEFKEIYMKLCMKDFKTDEMCGF